MDVAALDGQRAQAQTPVIDELAIILGLRPVAEETRAAEPASKVIPDTDMEGAIPELLACLWFPPLVWKPFAYWDSKRGHSR